MKKTINLRHYFVTVTYDGPLGHERVVYEFDNVEETRFCYENLKWEVHMRRAVDLQPFWAIECIGYNPVSEAISAIMDGAKLIRMY